MVKYIVLLPLLWSFVIGQDIACSNEVEYYQNGYIVLAFTFQRMVCLIGVSYSRIQIFKVIYAEAVVITL
jgi:hypothetical protein